MKTNKIPPIFFKYFKSSSSHEGFTLMELLVAFLMIGIILAFATSASVNMYRAENKLNAKNNRRAELSRALAYIENEIQEAVSVELDTSSSGCSSAIPCLKVNHSDTSSTLYAFEDISGNNDEEWLKPGTLKRKVGSSEQVLVDGLAIDGITTPTCSTDLTLAGTSTNNGFRFCLGNEAAPKKRVQIFLYGYAGIETVGVADDPIELSKLTFAQSN